MKTLNHLPASHAGIRDLTGLDFATNLTYLHLYANDITDISPLAGLTNLTYMNIAFSTNITDISPLAGLTNLKFLSLIKTNITDISPLAGLTNLMDLDLAYISYIEDISSLAGLTNLTRLRLSGADITDISPLAGLTNMTELHLDFTNVTDISPLANFTNLTRLNLANTNITDISPLAGLTNLTELLLHSNNIADISLLANFTNLTRLNLANNNITDISLLANFTNLTHLYVAYNNFTDTDVSALAGLIHLVNLDLRFNGITDISALVGLTSLERLNLRGNPLSDVSIAEYVSALQNMGVTVVFDSFRKGDFNVELIFVGSFAEKHRNMLQYVARRWMAVIVEELPDYEFTQGWSGTCGGQSYEIPAGERIDDLRIYMTTFDEDDYPDAVGWGGPSLLRDETHLPVLGCMGFDLKRADLEITGLHETGHVLGFGSIWHDLGLIRDLSRDDPNADTHFNGPLAIAAFNDAGGRDYTGAKVPVEKMDGGHWRYSVFEGELMRPGGGGALSAITVQSFADLGYGVDVTQADGYFLPWPTAGAKIALSATVGPAYDANVFRPDVFTQSDAERYGQGSIEGRLSFRPADGRTGRLESSERMWGSDENVNLWKNRRMWREGSSAQVEPKLTCGAGLINEPIYVVDSQGRVVSTIHR